VAAVVVFAPTLLVMPHSVAQQVAQAAVDAVLITLKILDSMQVSLALMVSVAVAVAVVPVMVVEQMALTDVLQVVAVATALSTSNTSQPSQLHPTQQVLVE
jgi:uncharacterized membrane protein